MLFLSANSAPFLRELRGNGLLTAEAAEKKPAENAGKNTTSERVRGWNTRVEQSSQIPEPSLYNELQYAGEAHPQTPLPHLQESSQKHRRRLPFLQRPLSPDRSWQVGQRSLRDFGPSRRQRGADSGDKSRRY